MKVLRCRRFRADDLSARPIVALDATQRPRHFFLLFFSRDSDFGESQIEPRPSAAAAARGGTAKGRGGWNEHDPREAAFRGAPSGAPEALKSNSFLPLHSGALEKILIP